MADRIFDWGARPAERLATVASLKAAKGRYGAFAQVTADTAETAAAAEAAGVEMVVCRARNVTAVRQGSSHVFVTAALGFAEAISADEVLRTALTALTDGADAVITARRLDLVEMLAAEEVPVMGHLGFVPRKSTHVGRVRTVGRTPDEAEALWHRFRRLEDAGAFAVECELIVAPLMTEISRRSGLVTVSLGSGPGAEVQFLFTEDICGESARLPRHARAWADLAAMQAKMDAMRREALGRFRGEVEARSFPAPGEMSDLPEAQIAAIRQRLDEAGV
ncbi:ketopantoate hydroxymethyltransferase [Rhodobacterales bacterium HKCCE2091]|nr:ketopantoate hydroxymethyltransferase [Rhodobacterales bacterium HKCCE2091]